MGTKVSGLSASVHEIAVQIVSLGLYLLLCIPASPRANGQSNSGTIKSFHDNTLNITLFYSSDFVPAPSAALAVPADTAKCIRPTLFANSAITADTSLFALSTVDNTCPELIRGVTELGPFTRERILAQLKQYGQPTIIQGPALYKIADHPAAITAASVTIPAVGANLPQTIYAATACVSASVVAKKHKKSDPVDPATRVVCIDFATQDSGPPTQLFSFIIKFDDQPLQPFFPGNIIRSLDSTARRKGN
jgi:hypothetical protein